MRKDLKPIVDAMKRLGWRLEHGKHIKLFSPSGRLVTFSVSPRGGYEVQNLLREINHIRRAEGLPDIDTKGREKKRPAAASLKTSEVSPQV